MVALSESAKDLDAETCKSLLPRDRSWLKKMKDIYTSSILEGSSIETEVKCLDVLRAEASKSEEESK